MTFYYRSDEGPQGTLQRIVDRETAFQYRQAQAAQTTPEFAELLDEYYQAYPDMDPGTMVALAKAGVPVTSNEAQNIAQASVEQEKSKGVFDRIGDVLSTVTEPVGDVVGGVAKGAGWLAEEAAELVPAPVKGSVRTAFVVLETGKNVVDTFVRGYVKSYADMFAEADDPLDVIVGLANQPERIHEAGHYGGIEWKSGGAPVGFQAIGDLISGEKVDLGSGYLPQGEYHESYKRASGTLRTRFSGVDFGGPDAPGITLGRTLAAVVSEPGTEPFNIISGLTDAGVAWFGDPAAAVGTAAKTAQVSTRAGRAGRALRDDGLRAAAGELATKPSFVDQFATPTTLDRFSAAIGDRAGRVAAVRKTVLPDVADQWFTKGGQRVAERIAETDSLVDLHYALGDKVPMALKVRLADASTPQSVMDILRPAIGTELREAPEFLGFKVRKANSKGIRLLGEMPGPFLDPNDLDQAVGEWEKFARNGRFSPELRNAGIEAIARNPGREAMVTTMSELMGHAADELVAKARPLGAAPIDREKAKGLTRMFNRDIEASKAYFLDEIAENRKSAGVMVNGTPIETQSPFLFTEYLDSVIPMPDAREMRRATSQLARLVDTTWFDRTTGAMEGLQNGWKKMTLLRGAYTVRVIGEEQIRMAGSGLDSMFAHPISAISALVADDKAIGRFIGTGKRRQSDVLMEQFFDDAGEAASIELKSALNKGWSGWADDTVFDRDYTLFRPQDDGYQRAWAQSIGELYTDPAARAVAAAEGNLDNVKDWYWDGPGQWLRKRLVTDHPDLATRAGADQYLDILWEGVQYRTGSDPRLMKAVATGAIDGKKFGKLNENGRWAFEPEFTAYLNDVVGPHAVKGQRIVAAKGGAKVGEAWDNATGWAFSHLMTKPTNYLSRSQTFRQKYWQRIGEMVPFMDDATRAKALANAEGVVTKAELAAMRNVTPNATRTISDLADADHLAKQYGLDETKKLLYDLSDKGQFFDVFRLIFPFGEAWKEVTTRWAKIGLENPTVIRRTQQIVNGARGNGFFHKDVNGEEVFTYPGSRLFSKLVTGVPFDINGRVSGLSLMTEVLPGVGPVVQLPAAAFLPDTPDWDFAREFMFPFGEQDYSQGLLESFLPGYAKNIAQLFEAGDPRLFANTVGATMDYLSSTGEYDLKNPDEVARLVDDARNKAKQVYLLRGMIAFGAPTAPSPEFLVKTKDGELDVARVVLQDFYAMQEEDYDSSVGRFLDKYGTDLSLLVQGKTRSLTPSLPTTKTSADWERANQGVVKDYKLTWGLFAPKGDTDDFDYVAYVRQFNRGDRETLTPEQRIALAQSKVARWVYAEAEKKVSEKPNKAERQWLAAVREKLREEFPGFGQDVTGLSQRASTDSVIKELERAIDDPRLKNTEQAKAARVYLAARRRALQWANDVGVKTLEAQAATPAREWLALAGTRIAERYPEFQEMYDTVFSWEVD